MTDPIRIAGASGFWGDSSRATPQLLTESPDVIVYDYLAEITMSILARARAKDPSKGYATDFVSAAMAPNLKDIAAKKVRIVSNAGGVNPAACAEALRQIIAEQGLNLTVACVLGDDLYERREALWDTFSKTPEMFTGEAFPEMASVQSINAYLGAFPIAKALDEGADIVITGRCVDSAVTLGACIHQFAWAADDWNRLAAGSLAGHIIECGPQATGGNFTDWQAVPAIENIGYPIATIDQDGLFTITKPKGTGGIVSCASVAEQMLYEIGDPQAYILPDVVCDFSEVKLEQVDSETVAVTGAIGREATNSYKVCATYAHGWRGGTYLTYYGIDADKKARAMAEAIFAASRRLFKQHGLPDFEETSVELIGAGSQFGEARISDEVAMKLAVKHSDPIGIGILLKESVGLGLATPPGLSGFGGNRPKPSPVVRLFSFLMPKKTINITIDFGDRQLSTKDAPGKRFAFSKLPRPRLYVNSGSVDVPLIQLAWARSGDKGNNANVGIIAREYQFLPFIAGALTEERVTEVFAHFLEENSKVERFYLRGSNALNFVLHNVLGGGGIASLRNDPQGKGYAQILLSTAVAVPPHIARSLNTPAPHASL